MRLIKSVSFLFISILFCACVTAQTIESENGKANNKQSNNSFSQFVFSFNGVVTKVIDGCTVEVEIKEERSGEIEGQKVKIPSNNPEYFGSKTIRLVNTKCVSIDKIIGSKSKEVLTQAVNGKTVEVFFRTYRNIKNSEIIGQLIIVENGKDAGLEQIRTGMAMFRNDKEKIVNEPDKRKYKDAEKNAKEQRIGMWGDSD